MKSPWKQLRRFGRVLWCMGLAAAIVNALPKDRPWGEWTATVLVIGLIMLGIPLLIVTAIDAGRELRDEREGSTWTRVLGYVLSVPQIALGLTAVLMGIVMIGWLLFLKATVMPWYVSLAIGLGMWPAVFGYGVHLLRTALRGMHDAPAAPLEAEEDEDDFDPDDFDDEEPSDRDERVA